MDVTQIPFVKHIGIERKEEGALKLEPTLVVQNHLSTIHASAQFTLAETQTGLYLEKAFPEYVGKVIPVVRASSVKFRHPSTTTLTANAFVEEAAKEKFIESFEKKSRAIITVMVELRDEDGTITMIGEYNWFVQRIEND